jgi:alpha-galactosidase
MSATTARPVPQPQDFAYSRAWADRYFADTTSLPFSFYYDEKKITGIPAAWRPVITARPLDANMVETTYESTCPETGLSVRLELLVYRDFPVVEWVVWFANQSDAATPILRDVQGIDLVLPGDAPVLTHCNGDFYSPEGYTPCETPLADGVELTCAPNGGRPCDGAFPYFRLQFAGGGHTLAVGWPGQWSATFTGVKQGVAIKAGQERTNLRLLPGERIRTPRITIMSWTGDTTRAINLWRRWYLAHVLPKTDGQPIPPLLAVAGTDTGEEFTAATEENQLRYMEKFAQAGIDYDVWWIDAGWYPCKDAKGNRRWPLTGTWHPDPGRFPRGLQPIATKAASHQARLLLWFEPERVTRDSQLFRDHPEWLLPGGEEDMNSLLNLGIPACRRWLTDHVCALIRQHGIGIYRQDFNFPPLNYWRNNEAPDRQGMNENLHIQGYLQYWDDLLARNPGLYIDSCSSGGRRNDLETMRRSVPLHYSDYGYGHHPIKLAFHHTLFSWIPYFKDSTLSWDQLQPQDDTRYDKQVDSYSFHCGMAGMLFFSIDIRRDDYDLALARRMIAIWRQAAPLLLYGDYYPATEFSRDPARWVLWQFNRPEHGDGMVQGIRHAACPETSFTIHLQGLEPDADYLFENAETGEQRRLSGATAASAGFTLSLPPRSGVIWFYRKLQAGGGQH